MNLTAFFTNHPFWGLLTLAVLVWFIWGTSSASGQASSGAQSTFLDPSVESAGMGGASVAVFWRDTPDDWANPAVLGLHRGIRYSYGKTQLVPDLADDVYFKSHRILLGGWGVGVNVSGKPIDSMGKLRLDYGVSEATDIDGNVIREFTSYEEIRTFGVGVSLLELASNIAEATGGSRWGVSRWLMVALGHSWKDIVVDLAPEDVTLDGRAARGEANEKDRGVLVRVTPFNGIGSDPLMEGRGLRHRLDLAAGFAQLNYDDSGISYIDEDQPDPIVEDRRLGFSARWKLALPANGAWIWSFASPTMDVAAAWQQSKFYDGGVQAGGTINRTGQELVLADVVSLRHGYVDDEVGTVQNDTWGVGISLAYRKAIGARFDWAQVPQSKFLRQDVQRRSITVFVDPLRIWRGLR
jgi:hypothetical protein